MKYMRLREDPEDAIAYPKDVDRLQKALHDAGYAVDTMAVYHAWDAYSDSMCAGWLMLSDDDSLNVQAILPYLVEVVR